MSSRAHARIAIPLDEEWRLRAECRAGNGHDPETWFPAAAPTAGATTLQRRISAMRYAEHVARAKRICGTCGVVPECLAYALAAGESDGIWGGLTAEEREDLS